jgi:hypothetical protein
MSWALNQTTRSLGNAPAKWGELVAVMMSREPNDQAFAFEPGAGTPIEFH